MNKLALGTVQFGLDYGINNNRGKILKLEVFDILNLAQKNGINVLDTAHAYGDSEKVIGEYIKNNQDKFNIISKVPEVKNRKELKEYFNETLENLNCSKIYAYLFHNFQSYRNNPSVYDEILGLKRKFKINKIGFSLYHPRELEYLLKNKMDFDIVQIPYNIFDQRFEPYLSDLKASGVEVHVRSIFLQGLVFKSPDELEGEFKKIYNKIKTLKMISKNSGLSVAALCIGFGIINDNIDKVIIGVDNIDNLSEDIENSSVNTLDKVKNVYEKLKKLQEDDENIILPINWKK